MDLPIPLGGTSNHFRADALRHTGGWDPFNVTEDADLGMRLASYGYKIGVIDSTTWEEAPIGYTQWLRQRTRWFKGWTRLVKLSVFALNYKVLPADACQFWYASHPYRNGGSRQDDASLRELRRNTDTRPQKS
jgi:cellulose synthase/poly-beta-1,6-N-acetylglucosamine synthase-like glycosyltransferase